MIIVIFLILIIESYSYVNNTIICSKGYGVVYDNEENKLICEPCQKGYYSFGGNSECLSCREYNNESNKNSYYSDRIGSDSCQYVTQGMFTSVLHSEVLHCSNHCEQCIGDIQLGKCIKCEAGYELVNEGMNGCRECDENQYSDGYTQCLQLPERSYVIKNEFGKRIGFQYCPKGCLSCDENNCFEYDESLTNELNLDYNETKFISYCKTYINKTRNEYEEIHCNECYEPYILQSDGLCHECPKYYHYYNDECVRNKNNCIIQLNDECLECEYNYILSNGSCQESSLCLVRNHRTCDVCSTNVLSNNGNCNEMESCIYSENNQCLKCPNGLYVNQTTKSCESISEF